MPKKTGIAMLAVGAVLILSALLLFFHNRQEDVQAGQEAESLLANVEAVIDAQATREPTPAGTEIPGTTPTSSATPLDPEMPVVELDGYAYVGYVEIPALELKLPVMSEWDYNRLKIAPCRQFGSSRTDDLVIAAHNYQNHFGRLKDLQTGNAVIFTDMEGVINSNAVIEHFKSYAGITALTKEISTDLLHSVTIYPDGRMNIRLNLADEIKALMETLRRESCTA